MVVGCFEKLQGLSFKGSENIFLAYSGISRFK